MGRYDAGADVTYGPISRTMQRAITCLRDGGTISHAERPRMVSSKTMAALEKRGMVRWDGDAEYGHWVLTGVESPLSSADQEAADRIAKWARRRAR